MNVPRQNSPDLSPEREDPELHYLLSALPVVGPSDGFADRVMAQVSVEPTVLQPALLGRKRLMWLAGTALGGSVAASISVIVLAIFNWSVVASAGAWTADLFLGSLQGAQDLVAQTWNTIASVPYGSQNFATGAATVAVILSGNAWCLWQLLREHKTVRARS